jgi:hypothetical protein
LGKPTQWDKCSKWDCEQCGHNRRSSQRLVCSLSLFKSNYPFTLLVFVKSVGILDLVFNDLRCRGSFQVRIEFLSDLPICILSGSKYAKIVGDVCATHELAKTSAITKAFAHLSRVRNVVLVDISSPKESSLLNTRRYLYGNVNDGLILIDFMI